MPVSLLVSNVVMLTVSSWLGVSNLRERIALSRQQPGRTNFAGVGGRGGVPFLHIGISNGL
jgi:hypothetical protein